MVRRRAAGRTLLRGVARQALRVGGALRPRRADDERAEVPARPRALRPDGQDHRHAGGGGEGQPRRRARPPLGAAQPRRQLPRAPRRRPRRRRPREPAARRRGARRALPELPHAAGGPPHAALHLPPLRRVRHRLQLRQQEHARLHLHLGGRQPAAPRRRAHALGGQAHRAARRRRLLRQVHHPRPRPLRGTQRTQVRR